MAVRFRSLTVPDDQLYEIQRPERRSARFRSVSRMLIQNVVIFSQRLPHIQGGKESMAELYSG